MMKPRRGVLVGLVLGWISLPIGLLARAEEGTPTPESTTKSPLIKIPSQRVPIKSAKRGKRREQKETEGTEAPERFEADTILKSQYSVEGQPLEVDPD